MKRLPSQSKQRMEQLDHIALDIAFLLISVIQGIALVSLASSAEAPLTSLQFSTWLYMVVAFLFILIFWSGAIIHAVGFINWPIDLIHSFLYFLASIFELLAITNLIHPVLWFLFLFFFQLVALALYAYDLHMIKQRKGTLAINAAGKALYSHIYTEQKKELQYYLPALLCLSLGSLLALYFEPSIFIQRGYHEVLILVQFLFAFSFLVKEVHTFNKRSLLLIKAKS